MPPGVTNYFTPAGKSELLTEKQKLIDERSNLAASNENERRVAINHLNARLQLLENRIAEAKVVDLAEPFKKTGNIIAHNF